MPAAVKNGGASLRGHALFGACPFLYKPPCSARPFADLRGNYGTDTADSTIKTKNTARLP